MRNLAIIPARGGSKRIPRKNIRDFLGKPIIAYSIEAAIQSGLFEEVMVSTDDQEIAEISIRYGAKIPFLRSSEMSGDNATTIAVIREVETEYKNQLSKEFDLICCIYPTSPLIKVEYLSKGLNLLLENNYASVFPVVAFGYPIWRSLEINSEGKAEMIWPEFQYSRSQDLKKVYHDAGGWYWMNMHQIESSIFSNNSGCVLLSELEVQDIDNLSDWNLAEIKYKLLSET